jgi:predicted negative regulator of RcsB-dependent stress response
MDIYDQHEQSERVRSWLKDNGTAIVSGVAIGLAAIFGYHQWQGHRINQAHTAAELYERSRQTASVEADGDGAVPPADAARSQLRGEHARNGYAVLAALEQAQAQVRAGDPEGAQVSLAWAREQAREPAVRSLAALRLARLQLAAGRGEDALASLAAVEGEGFAAERAELRGDILVQLERIEEARAAYLEAQAAGPADAGALAMKMAEHGAEPPQPGAGA